MATVSAIGDDGKEVDWWFAYKVPQLRKDANTLSATGYEYIYYDPTLKEVVHPDKKTLKDNTSALGRTLDAVFKDPPSTRGWILYNDEMPDVVGRKDDGTLGHTKGVIAFDTASKTAVWLLHSWPKYSAPNLVGMPTPMYGQTFLCISINLETAAQLATQMANHQEPQVYLPHVPPPLDKSDPLYRLTQPLNANAVGDSDDLKFTSRGGLPFRVIAKNRKWGKDFWNDLVAHQLGEDMDVETWIRGPIAPIQDRDGVHKVFDIKYIDLRKLGAPYTWPESKDHAKWGITKENNWVCVGDMNRMISQEKRGGGTIALQNETLWKALKTTDLLVPPPGHTEEQARKLIKDTHKAPA